MKEDQNYPYLSQANFVGQGFDITGRYNIPDSLITPLLDPLKAGTMTFDFLGTTYVVPDYILPAEDTSGVYIEDTSETREEFQGSFSVTAGVHASYGAFSAQMEASYGKQFAQSSSFFYSYRNFYSRLALLSINLSEAQKALSDRFIEDYNALPNQVTQENLSQFVDFFNDYGMYFTSNVALGASLEYYVALSKESKMSKTEISASVKVDYKALFFSGGVSSDISSSEEWKNYTSNRTVNIAVQGGDPALVAKLGNVDPDNPNMTSVALYNQWADSIAAAPAVADFRLKGIWELIPDKNKAEVVYDAFKALQTSMRPRLSIETSSERGKVPVVILGEPLIPQEPAKFPIGYQLLIFDRSNITPSGVLFNRYYGVPADAWYSAYEAMYDEMMADIKQGGFDNTRKVLVLVSYGMSTNAPPNFTIYPFLRAAGGGPELQKWVEWADPGSSMSRWPGTYLLVGVPNLGPNTGVEVLVYDVDKNYHTPVTQEVFFYLQRGSDLYTLSAGPSSLGPDYKFSINEAIQSKQPDETERRFVVQGKAQAFQEALE